MLEQFSQTFSIMRPLPCDAEEAVACGWKIGRESRVRHRLIAGRAEFIAGKKETRIESSPSSSVTPIS